MKRIIRKLRELPRAERPKLLEGATSEELIERMQTIDKWRTKHLEEFKKDSPRNLRAHKVARRH